VRPGPRGRATFVEDTQQVGDGYLRVDAWRVDVVEAVRLEQGLGGGPVPAADHEVAAQEQGDVA